MGIVNFLMNNYIYFAVGAGVLVLALIGYAIDSAKTKKLMKKMTDQNEEKNILDVPLAGLENITLGETVNKAVEADKLQNVTNQKENIKADNEIESMLAKTTVPEFKE